MSKVGKKGHGSIRATEMTDRYELKGSSGLPKSFDNLLYKENKHLTVH